MKNIILGMILGAVMLAVGLTVYHDLPNEHERTAVDTPHDDTKSPAPGNTASDDASRISRETAERIISEQKQKDETAKIKADWEKEHNNRANFIAMIYLERAADIEVVRQNLLPLERNLTASDRKRVDEALGALRKANERLNATYQEIFRDENHLGR